MALQSLGPNTSRLVTWTPWEGSEPEREVASRRTKTAVTLDDAGAQKYPSWVPQGLESSQILRAHVRNMSVAICPYFKYASK